MKMVEIQLDKKRILKFGTQAFVTIEKALDAPIDKVDFERQETIYALLYAGLIHMDRKLTLEKIYDIVDKMIDKEAEKSGVPFMEAFKTVLTYIGEKVGEAMGNNTGEEKPIKG